MAMLSSALPELSTGIETKFTDFLPAPATVINVALAFTVIVAIQYYHINPLTLAVNAFGDLFSSTKPKQILVQVNQVSRIPTPSIKVPPTPTVQYRYQHQPESTSIILYAIALCAVFVLVGAIIIVLRKKSTSSPSSSVNPRFDSGSVRKASDNSSRSSSFVGDILGLRSSNLAHDNSDKNAPGFLENFKLFLILFFILTSFTHGGLITQKIRSLAVRDDLPFSSNNATAALEPYFYQASELVAVHFDDFPATFTGGNILVSEIVETLTFSSTPSSTLPSGLSLLPLPTMTSNSTSAYPIGLSLVVTTPSPTTSSSSKAALDLAFEYIKLFILSFFFCILIPIMSFLMTVLPPYFDYVQLSKAISADQREVISIHFSSHELLLIKVSAESCHGNQRGCSRDRGRWEQQG
jgi:hypothetical protein